MPADAAGGEGTQGRVVPVEGFDGELSPVRTLFDNVDRAAIAAHWWAATAVKPKLFDGRVLIGVDVRLAAGRLVARHMELDFAAFHWWRSRGEGRGLVNVFGAAAVVAADGGVLLGRMAAHTAAAGMSYFPCGTPDLSDVTDGKVDLELSISRELAEETGLAWPTVRPTPKAYAVFAPGVVAFVRRYESDLGSAELAHLIDAHLAADAAPELDGVRFVHSAAELSAASPPYVHLVMPHLTG